MLRVPAWRHELRPHSDNAVGTDEHTGSTSSANSPALGYAVVLEDVEVRRRRRDLFRGHSEGMAKLVMLLELQGRCTKAHGRQSPEEDEEFCLCGLGRREAVVEGHRERQKSIGGNVVAVTVLDREIFQFAGPESQAVGAIDLLPRHRHRAVTDESRKVRAFVHSGPVVDDAVAGSKA